jgi:hypothetical protein
MTGADLVALSNYFRDHRWAHLRKVELTVPASVLIRTNAGVRLRQLGRLTDARESFGTVVREIDPESSAAPELLEDAAYAAAQNTELLVIAGKLRGDADSALANGELAVKYANRGADAYFKMHARSSLAEVHFMLGEKDRAAELFDAAMAIDREQEPAPPFLYSQSLFRYGYFLIEDGRTDELLAGADGDENWGRHGASSSLLSEAIRLLVLGAAYRSLVEEGDTGTDTSVQAARYLDSSIDAFRQAGYADYYVRGLLERAHFRRVRGAAGDFGKVREDLDRAAFETRRGQMDLLYADVLLQRCAYYLALLSAPAGKREGRGMEEAVADALENLPLELGTAESMVNNINYFRRSAMLEELCASAASIGLPATEADTTERE